MEEVAFSHQYCMNHLVIAGLHHRHDVTLLKKSSSLQNNRVQNDSNFC